MFVAAARLRIQRSSAMLSLFIMTRNEWSCLRGQCAWTRRARDTCVATRHCMLLKTAEVNRTYSKRAHAIEFHTLDSSAHVTCDSYNL